MKVWKNIQWVNILLSRVAKSQNFLIKSVLSEVFFFNKMFDKSHIKAEEFMKNLELSVVIFCNFSKTGGKKHKYMIYGQGFSCSSKQFLQTFFFSQGFFHKNLVN